MKKNLSPSLFALTLLAVALLPSMRAESQPQAKGLVQLQSSTPGIGQAGHMRIGGTGLFGAVGIGVLQPAYALEVAGGTSMLGFHMPVDAGAGRVLTSDADGNGSWAPLPDPVDVLWQSSGANIYFSTGNVGIGLTSPTFPLTVTTPASGRVISATHTATSGIASGVFGQISTTSGGHGVFGLANSSSGTTYGVYGQSNSTSGTGVYGTAPASSGTTYGGRFLNSSSGGIGVFGWAESPSGATRGVFGQSSSASGIGVQGAATAGSGTTYGGQFVSSSPNGFGVFGWAESPSGATRGVFGQSSSTGGVGVYALASATSGSSYGVFSVTSSPSGTGVYAGATATTGTNSAVYAENNSTSGRGLTALAVQGTGVTYGVWGQSDSVFGTGVYGLANAQAAGGSYGVHGVSRGAGGIGVFGAVQSDTNNSYGVVGRSLTGRGVYGEAITASGAGIGVYGRSAGLSGIGIVGEAQSGTGVYGFTLSNGGVGVYAEGPMLSVWGNALSGDGRGVLGSRPASGSGHGVYFNNGLGGTGTKAFQMDHPIWPETHILNHFCTEGPEPYNVYRGNVVTDAKGFATISLPDYFDQINRDPTYHLTVIDDGEDFVMAKVVSEVQGNRFTIRTSQPRVKVSWRVDGIRNDRWIREHGFRAEQEKAEESKGKYLSPELYGAPEEQGVHYVPPPKAQ